MCELVGDEWSKREDDSDAVHNQKHGGLRVLWKYTKSTSKQHDKC